MTKFIISSTPNTNEELPVLYDILFAGRYYLHKGKKLQDSAQRLLDDVFREMRGKGCPEQYKNIVDLCKKYPAIYQVQVSLIMNDYAPKILRKERFLLKQRSKDENSLNRTDLEPYTPEWMLTGLTTKMRKSCNRGRRRWQKTKV